ncbi:IS66 family insertion sequence element accessory protein TnpA [Limnoglobus roseus]|uniref:Transposase n=1 Tax=Limnoglobus roseus TaxID=2598579 RepID=A0A5C1AD74_9BACT|nr:hypothetical protein [Limnoglobus roseus]QEL16650.1 hypothetical protein PX52LOC_03611 [Limnoglobus roseus]
MSDTPLTSPPANPSDREQFWRDTVAAFATSGLSVRAFCLANGLSEKRFYTWRKNLGLSPVVPPAGSPSDAPPARGFVPVRVVSDATAEVVLPGGVVVVVTRYQLEICMAAGENQTASLTARIEEQAARNAAAQAQLAEQLQRSEAHLRALTPLVSRWVHFSDRKVFSSKPEELAAARQNAIDDLLEIGRLLKELGMLTLVLQWGGSEGLSREIAAEIVRASARWRTRLRR